MLDLHVANILAPEPTQSIGHIYIPLLQLKLIPIPPKRQKRLQMEGKLLPSLLLRLLQLLHKQLLVTNILTDMEEATTEVEIPTKAVLILRRLRRLG
jgi:hypothetical protein